MSNLPKYEDVPEKKHSVAVQAHVDAIKVMTSSPAREDTTEEKAIMARMAQEHSVDNAMREHYDTIITTGINALMRRVARTEVMRGWHTPGKGRDIPRDIALIHSELSEALEHDRRGTMDDKLPHRIGLEVEFADALIRMLCVAKELGLDIAGAAIEKNDFNLGRLDHDKATRIKSY